MCSNYRGIFVHKSVVKEFVHSEFVAWLVDPDCFSMEGGT